MKSNLNDKIIVIGREAWSQNLVAGRGGNISLRKDNRIIMTKNGACLGMLTEDDFVEMDLEGNIKNGKNPSTETRLHLALYNQTDAKAVVHLHPPFTTAYFLENDELKPSTFEERLLLGNVLAIKQDTPSVTDIKPVLEAFKLNNVVVLKNHGVVAIGEDLCDAFFLIQVLEHAIKIEVVRRLTNSQSFSPPVVQPTRRAVETDDRRTERPTTAYKLFSKEQIDKIVEMVNNDENFIKQAEEMDLTLTLAVKMEETGQVYKFNFIKGRIAKVTNDENAEFLVSGSRLVWEAIFKRQIDPFVATTQKKLHLKGDFAKLSKWYSPFARLFSLWQKVPIE